MSKIQGRRRAMIVSEQDMPLRTEVFSYAVVDLATSVDLRAPIQNLHPGAAQPLFDRNLARDLLEIGPWLVRLAKAPEVHETLVALSDEVPWS